MDNVSATPHCSGLTVEASEALSRTGAEGILEVFYHKPLTWPVNKVVSNG
jgi:phosphoglycerate dehydrogenase-like enzyme